jgi:hypothetical protein
MSAPSDLESLVRETFADVALAVAATTASYPLPDDLLWSLLRRLDRVRVRTFQRLTAAGLVRPTAPSDRPLPVHPAVEAFLARNQEGQP